MSQLDMLTGALILNAQANYAAASWRQILMAWAFGSHRKVQHLGCIARIGVWQGKNYLLTFRAA